jgi:transposase
LGYEHHRIRYTEKVYVSDDVHTNTIEGLWSHLKWRISGVYRGVSTKYLPTYLVEYVFRYNNRGDERGLFMAFLDRIEKASPDPSSS